MHQNFIFRMFMRHCFAPLGFLAVVVWIYYVHITFGRIPFVTESARLHLLLMILGGMSVLVALIVLAHLVIRRHYDRWSQARGIIERAGGQAYVDTDLARIVQDWIEAGKADATPANMERFMQDFRQSASWYRRMEFKVRPFHSYAPA